MSTAKLKSKKILSKTKTKGPYLKKFTPQQQKVLKKKAAKLNHKATNFIQSLLGVNIIGKAGPHDEVEMKFRKTKTLGSEIYSVSIHPQLIASQNVALIESLCMSAANNILAQEPYSFRPLVEPIMPPFMTKVFKEDASRE